MSTFEENLKTVPQAEHVVLLRVYNAKDELVALMPNLPGRCGPLRVFHPIQRRGLRAVRHLQRAVCGT